ncbi:MAG TPA: stage V sporulation protein S [Chloroflexi bacterium]|jgi:stage V sporulation protein S|nr:stage V sporulation protein S [Chloroflexota bacterium]
MATVIAPDPASRLARADAPHVLKVSSTSRPTAVAGAIAGIVRESGHTELQAIGAGAVNQATKAIAIARRYLAPEGIDIVSIPDLTTVVVADQDRTAVRLIVETR